MAETNQFVLNDQSSQCQQTDKIGIQSSVNTSKEQHGDSLQKLLQKAAMQPHKQLAWSQSDVCRTPQNLFLEGFKDCASEVIRFLTEHENVEDNNPLLIGLESHLMKVSKTICHETINDVDRYEADIESKKYDAFMSSNVNNAQNDNERFSIQMSNFSPCLLSPIVSRSAGSSVSDTSTAESDFSMSLTSEKSDQSLISEANSSLHCTSLGNTSETLIDHNKADDVFHSPSSHYQSSAPDAVLSLRDLAMNALQNTIHSGHIPVELQESSSNETSFSSTCAESSTHCSLTSGFSMQMHLPSMDHSSPIQQSSAHNFTYQDNSCNFSPCLCIPSRSERCNVPQFSKLSALNESFGINFNPNSLPLPQQPHPLLHGETQSGTQTLFPNFVSLDSDINNESQRDSDFSQHISSILELKANFLPGIESSSVTSENFADILLAVESCRFHEDPRVRGLAEELVHLIHNDDFDDEDDLNYDDDEDDDVENMYNINGESGFESGVEMMDESADWTNAVDMVEQ